MHWWRGAPPQALAPLQADEPNTAIDTQGPDSAYGRSVDHGRYRRPVARDGADLAPTIRPPLSVELRFAFVRIIGARATLSGHGPLNPDGTLAEPLGKLGREVTLEQGYAAARLSALSILGSLKRALGDLDRSAACSRRRVFEMVNSAPGFQQHPSVINGFSDLIIELYGPDVGAHSRSAVGLAELAFNIPVEIEAEVALARPNA